MKYFVVQAHPEPRSFNGALLTRARETLAAAGHELVVSDLYAIRFDPVSGRGNFTTTKDPAYFKQQIEEMHAAEHDGFSGDLKAEMEKLVWCDCLVFQFPLWWFSLPAILKGWVDRVFAMGFAYGHGRVYSTGIFKGKRAMASLTTGGPQDSYVAGGSNGDLDKILFHINHGMLAFVGMDVVPPFVAWSPARVTPEQRAEYLDEFSKASP